MRRRDFLTSTLLAGAGLSCSRPVRAVDQPAAVPFVGQATQLFVDLDRVEALENVEQDFHSAQKHPANPVLRRVKPWESDRGTWGSVIYDDEDRVFKAWYGGMSGNHKEFRPGDSAACSVLCYATSQDGVQWDRPALGLHEVMGTRQNNVIIGDDHHNGLDHWESVLQDPMAADRSRRYKALGWSSQDWDGPMSGIYTMTSADGLHWTHTPEPVFHYHPRPGTNDLGPVGDSHTLMIDTLQHRYVAFLRRLPHRAFAVSGDFTIWTPPRMSIRARPDEKVNTIYNHLGFVYGDRYLGLLTYFDRNPSDTSVTVWLLTSRDGERWERPDTKVPFIGNGTIGEWDRFNNLLTGAPPIRVGGELYIYYRGLASRHGPYDGNDNGDQRNGGLGLATLRVDGFASLAASYDGGQVTTRPMRYRGQHVRINARADFGQILVECLDDQGQVLPGFQCSECLPVQSDGIDTPVRWRTKENIAELANRPLKLRFVLHNARLYSYCVVR